MASSKSPPPKGTEAWVTRPPEREHPDLGRAGADVHDHRGDGFFDSQPGAEGDCDRQLDETDALRPGLLVNARSSARRWTPVAVPDAQQSTVGWLTEPTFARRSSCLATAEVRSKSASWPWQTGRTMRHLARAAPAQARGLGPKGHETVAPELDGGDRRLVDDDAVAAHGDEGARRAEVDCEVGTHLAGDPGGGSTGREARLQSVPPVPGLVLPDRRGRLQGVDQVPAGVEGLGPVRGRHHHDDGSLAEADVADPVPHDDAPELGPALPGGGDHRLETRQHLVRVSLVVDGAHPGPPLGVVPHGPDETRHRST